MRRNWEQTQISSCQSLSSEHKYIFAIMARAITIRCSGGKRKNFKLNRSSKNGFIEEVFIKLDLEKLVNCFQSYMMTRSSRQAEHQRYKDLKEHEKLEVVKVDWCIGHKERKGDDSRRQGQ